MRATPLLVPLVLVPTACSAPSGTPTEPATASGSAEAALSHVVSTDTAYYLTGPQQARPPEGKFEAGTKVKLVQDAGSYALVESEDGVKAYVSSGALKPIDVSR